MELLNLLKTRKIKSIKVRNQFLLGLTFENILETTGSVGSLVITSYMIYLGFSEQQMGIILSLIGLTQLVQIFSTILYVYTKSTKRTIIFLKALRIFFFFLLVLVPKYVPENFNYTAVFVLILLRFIFTNLIGGGLLEWNDCFVPNHLKGSYYAKRNIIGNAIFIATSIIIGIVLDRFDGQYWMYMIVIFTACLLGVVDLFILGQIDYSVNPARGRLPIKTVILSPLKDKKYFRFLIFSILWSFADSLGRPYLNIYVIKYMAYSYALIAIIGSTTAFIKLFAGYSWGKLIDIKDDNKIITYSGIGFALMNLVFIAMRSDSPWIYAFGVIANGIFMIGFNISKFNYNLRLSEGELRNAYLSLHATVIGFSSFISIYICSTIVGFVAGRTIRFLGTTFNAYQGLFFTSSILHLVAIYYFAKVVNNKK